MKLSHADLCAIAVKWLQRSPSNGGPGCIMAVSEVAGGWSGEIPDAIGFSLSEPGYGSTVVEVKVSRPDFLADFKKPHRQVGGMGNWRYYMAPRGMLRLEEMPAGWGLIEVTPGGICKVASGAFAQAKKLGYGKLIDQCAEWRHESDNSREQWMLVKLLARLGDVESLNRARKDAFAQSAMFERRIVEVSKNLSESRRMYNRASRELALYKEKYGEILPNSESRLKATIRQQLWGQEL